MSSVLIVEDYESIKNLYVDAFTRAGFTVDTAKSGSEGLEKTAKTEFDLIILDILMLDLAGTDFLKDFETAKHPGTKVVVVSNLDSPNVIEKAKGLGAVAYLIKSQYTPDQLVEAAKPYLQQ
jgi:DNA-binding NtrC family response regulator